MLPFSSIADAAKLSESAGPLELTTVKMADAPPVVSTVPLAVVTWAVMVAVWLPLSRPSLIAAIGKVADVWPGLMMICAGTVAAPLLPLERVTITGAASGPPSDTVAVVASGPPASLT